MLQNYEAAFIDIYNCLGNCEYAKCKKCRSVILFSGFRKHIAKCWHGITEVHRGEGYAIENYAKVPLKTFGGYNIFLDILDITCEHMIYFKFDLDGLSEKILKYTGLLNRMERKRKPVDISIFCDNHIFGIVIDHLLSQSVMCQHCQMWFDSYPTRELLDSHIASCLRHYAPRAASRGSRLAGTVARLAGELNIHT